MSASSHPRRRRSIREIVWLARRIAASVALLAAILAALALGFAGFGVREEMFDLDYAVRTLAVGWAPALALLAMGLGVLALLAGVLVPPRADRVVSLLAIALGAATYAGATRVGALAAANPPIHDVATDWTDPLMLGPAAVAARGPDANPVRADAKVQPQPQDPDLTGTPIAEVNLRTCRGAVPLILAVPPAAAYDKARVALAREKMPLTTENAAAGRLEAVATMPWLNLKSDVVVRIRPEGAGARIDMRSVSRTGIADLGWNCGLVSRLRQAMAR